MNGKIVGKETQTKFIPFSWCIPGVLLKTIYAAIYKPNQFIFKILVFIDSRTQARCYSL